MGNTKFCRYCGNVVYADEETCEYCGKYLLKEYDGSELCCAKCKDPVNEDDNFCQKCGAIFNIEGAEKALTPEKHNLSGIHYNIIILSLSIAISIALTILVPKGEESTIGGNLVFFSIAYIAAEFILYIYFLPSIIAIENNNPNTHFVFLCNLILGATVIGWITAFALAFKSDKKA